ncbi:hypothetical protein ASD11_17215 [Aeromicrobium sp. Root495]|uniref:hypothetical protein n=1 Tax=Aeromicrobium sp. Root495 TaxID=1736550 RepID=UPI0006FD24BB|nr:hypothetical protein [Aeromicrobium sp. Root495]KQY55292.1 hypothetical protein ASD11_17215 [Aeromicrobium sp. Root495]
MAEAPRKKQLAVSRRVRVPGADADWAALRDFAQTFDASFFLSSSMAQVATVAYRPAFAAADAGTLDDGELGVVLLRAALWFQARSDTMSGAAGFSGPEVERLYRSVCAELHRRTGGWVDENR